VGVSGAWMDLALSKVQLGQREAARAIITRIHLARRPGGLCAATNGLMACSIEGATVQRRSSSRAPGRAAARVRPVESEDVEAEAILFAPWWRWDALRGGGSRDRALTGSSTGMARSSTSTRSHG